GLSSHELNQPGCYRDVSDTSVVAQFKLAHNQQLPNGSKDENIYFLAWTTTPWTLPSNTALSVGKNIDYVLVKTYNQYTHKPIQVVLAKALVSKQFAGKFNEVSAESDLNSYSETDKKIPYYIAESFKGSALEGIRYEQLMPLALPYEQAENAFRIILGDFVTTEDGTGIVHTAPTFGADDAKVAAEAHPPVPPMLVLDENQQAVPLVDLQGKFRENLGYLSGKYVKNEYYDDAEMPDKSIDVEICIDLKEQNKAFKVEKYKHSYPHCWRTDKPILYYPLDSWFIKITQVRDRLAALNQNINWKPESTGKGRFGNWLTSANDWNLSRSRFWGIPLPIWRTEDGSETKIVASIAQLKSEVEQSVAAGFMTENPLANFVENDLSEANYEQVDLHKNVVDQLVLVSDSGKKMQRESDLIDVWFDSGSMPYAQWHYPFENKEAVEKTLRKADFIAEGVDQTRGWFYTLHAIAGILFDDVAYKNVVSNGLVLDKNGHKMSKRLGNAVDPFVVIKNYGADAVRWYMISNANPWDNLKFDEENILEVLRKFFGTLYNTYGFFALYANIDGFNHSEDEVPLEERTELDQWILSELNSLMLRVTEAYEQYEPTKAARAISDFVQDYLSNWYVRLCRRRFWKGEYNEDKVAAYQTLFQCLKQLSVMIAPIAPFYAERLYLDLTKNTQGSAFESVHIAEFPT
ncbi:MAG: isoleucine--tRNA ligase, partial [Flavobacteriaceae bacterium]|nr:isoleucine--tRNA ligase [Flavobacteriaceae bacterium]